MIITTVVVSLVTAAPAPSMQSSLHGVDGWQGIQALTIPGQRGRSVRLAKPVTLDLTLGGFAQTEVLDGTDGTLQIQQHGGRVHGVLKSIRYGDWTIHGDADTGHMTWTPAPVWAYGPGIGISHDDSDGHHGGNVQFDDGQGSGGGSGGSGSNSSPPGPDDTGRVLDILVAYTPAALANAGSTDDMHASIEFWVNQTNDIFFESQIPTRLRLVDTAEVNYQEGPAITPILFDLARENDGIMDEVHTLRDAAGADLVMLIIRDGTNACGVGFRISNPGGVDRQAFAVVADSCADNNYSFAHELGHNLGGCHNIEDASSCGPTADLIAPYGHRFQGDFDQWRSVMSYNQSNMFRRAPRFSNPNVFWDGAATGTDEADNASTMTEMRVPTAAYRTSLAPMTCLGDFDNDNRIAVEDLLEMLNRWGIPNTNDAAARRPDLNGDARIDVADLVVLLHEFGTCPT